MDPDRLKITQVGDSDVGKSCMLRMFTENLFMHQFMPTYGVDYKNKTIEMEDQTMVKLQIWDTAGQPTMRKIVPIHISGSDGVMVFFDLNSRETYESVREWMQMIAMDARNESMQIILIGTKADLTATRVVSNEEAVALAAEFAVPYIETSTKDNTNVAKVRARKQSWHNHHCPPVATFPVYQLPFPIPSRPQFICSFACPSEREVRRVAIW